MSSSSEIISGGTRANKTANALENFVEDLLNRNGYTEFMLYKKQVFAMPNTIGGKHYSKHPCCENALHKESLIF